MIADGAADESIDIDLDEIDLEKLSEVNSAIAVEKEIAADTLGVISQATGAHFLPYVEGACLELEKLLAHYYEGIRKSALQSLLEIVQTFYTLSSPQPWVQGTAVVSFLSFSISVISKGSAASTSSGERAEAHRPHPTCPLGDVRYRRSQVSTHSYIVCVSFRLL